MKTTRVVSIAIRAAALAVAIGRLARAANQPPPLASAPTGAATGGTTGAAALLRPGSISIVIPARNEAERIVPLLQALRGATNVIEILVVDDQSTDSTAAIAASYGAVVISGQALPDGWAGKAWAVQQGIDQARGTWIVTLDADTRPGADLPAALIARMVADGTQFATVAGNFECPTTGVAWLHPAMLTTLVYRFGPPGGQRRPDRQLANGQCMAFANDANISLSDVRSNTVEDVALARHLAGRGLNVAMYDGSSLLTTRMYEDLGDAWSGWGRSLALPGVETAWRQSLDLAIVVLAQVLPLPRVLLRRRGDIVDVVGVLMRLGTLVGTRRAYRSVSPVYWLSPLADSAAAVAIARGIVARQQTWRGRSYSAD